MSRGAVALLDAARERFANRDYYGALLCLDDDAIGDDAWADMHHLRGVCYSLLDRHAEAVSAFDRALQLNPRYLEAHLHRALALTALGRDAEAAVAFAAAREAVGPDVAGLAAPIASRLANEHARLGELYAEAGAVQDAVREYRRAAQLGPTFLDLRLRLARLLMESGNPLEARDELNTVLHARPDWTEARVQLGLARHLAGDSAGARETWRRCLDEQPGLERVAAYLAMVDRIPE
jgi:tetratricopeptide (TPR) repeat protein